MKSEIRKRRIKQWIKRNITFMSLEKYTKPLGAKHYVLNSMKDNSIRFWKKLGFRENGIDEWGMKLFRLY